MVADRTDAVRTDRQQQQQHPPRDAGRKTSLPADDAQRTASFYQCLNNGMYPFLGRAMKVWRTNQGYDCDGFGDTGEGADGGADATTPPARYYRAERDLFRKHLEPLMWGPAAGIFLFATFRISGSRSYARFLHDRYLVASSTSRPAGSPQRTTTTAQQTTTMMKDNNTPKPNPPPKKVWKSYLERKTEDHARRTSEWWQFTSDLLLSGLAGIAATIWLSDATKLREDFVAAPLLPGRSLVYDSFCQDLINTYHANATMAADGGGGANELDKKDQKSRSDGDDDDDVDLVTFHTFVKNCELRSKYIEQQQRRRRQQQLATTGAAAERRRPVEIVPYPGLKGYSLPTGKTTKSGRNASTPPKG